MYNTGSLRNPVGIQMKKNFKNSKFTFKTFNFDIFKKSSLGVWEQKKNRNLAEYEEKCDVVDILAFAIFLSLFLLATFEALNRHNNKSIYYQINIKCNDFYSAK